ncbi:unnamed protein product [Parascedosporium putredinis]|uniref:Uncharacterized protein n=1 Tax=Parascedosporium putredinis TaxID=1442378 RepID=A0A9P1GYJ7_9PEZI|nr:unnamed protein product [Parascedosporium putredinis]CAI7990009.1 unnamed protein product [Parascedosporium putredinis]
MAVLIDLQAPPSHETYRVKAVPNGYSADMQRKPVQHGEPRVPQEPPIEPETKAQVNDSGLSNNSSTTHLLGTALSIYPIAVGVASHIDLVTLDSLSRTCRAAHDGLIQYRKALMASTLRCHQDELPVDPDDTFRVGAAQKWFVAVWQWRSRYIEVGVTDGDGGVTCGREADCLGAIDTEVEMDSAGEIPPPPTSTPSPPPSDRESLGAEPRSGYNVHPFEGAGGCVTNKATVKVRVGESVPEWHDERSASQILRRETEGKARRWCGWCWRVLPGEADLRRGKY